MPRAASLADTLLQTYTTRIGALTLIPSGGGVFEVTVNGTLVFSKKATRRFPEEMAIVDAVAAAGHADGA